MHTQHAAALGAALESCGKAPRMHAHGFKPRSAVDSRIGRSLMWQVHVRCWAGSGVCWVIEKAQRRPPVCMGSICGSAGEGRPSSESFRCMHVACMRSTCRGGSEDHVWGTGARWGWLRAGWVAEQGRPVHPVRASGNASGPGTRSYFMLPRTFARSASSRFTLRMRRGVSRR